MANYSYGIRTIDDKLLYGDVLQFRMSEDDVITALRREMKRFPNAHHCEYYELGVWKAKVKILTNF